MAETPAPILEFEELTLDRPDGTRLLERVHWALSPGAKARVEANSPQEATALLQLCAGVIHPQGGQIRLAGEALLPYCFSHPFLERGALAWVPPDGGLLVNQSLLANVSLPLRFVGGLGRTEARERALDWLARAGLAPLAERRPHALNPQERWLGALARSAAGAAELWLVDMPQGGLSPRLQQRAASLLAPTLEKADITVLLAGDTPWMEPRPGIRLRLEAGTLSSGSSS